MADADELVALFGKITTSDHDTLVQQFAGILRVDPGVALFFLEASNWNVEVAVTNFLANVGTGEDRMIYQPSTIPEVTLLSDLSETQSVSFLPGSEISMIWRFRNSGREPWPQDTRIVFVDGHQMYGPSSVEVNARPGEEIQFPCTLLAPSTTGTYAGTWRFVCNAGYFGDPLWIIITVALGDDEETDEISQKFISTTSFTNSTANNNGSFLFSNQFQQQFTAPSQMNQGFINHGGGFLKGPSFNPSSGHQPPPPPPPPPPPKNNNDDMDL